MFKYVQLVIFLISFTLLIALYIFVLLQNTISYIIANIKIWFYNFILFYFIFINNFIFYLYIFTSPILRAIYCNRVYINIWGQLVHSVRGNWYIWLSATGTFCSRYSLRGIGIKKVLLGATGTCPNFQSLAIKVEHFIHF